MSTKNNLIFECEKCGAQGPKWAGRCVECGAWGTLKEVLTTASGEAKKIDRHFDPKILIDFNDLSTGQFQRLKTNLTELDSIFGGGIVKGSITLIGGEPGVGKSTLVLQILQQLEPLNQPLLYVSGEESAEQIKLRLDRLGYKPKNLKFLGSTEIQTVQNAISSLKPLLVIIDSIQTMTCAEIPTEAGGVSQIRATTVKILETAKTNNIPIIITGHVTKDGGMAGPKTLEHLVDTVIYLESERLHGFRLIRSVKNRFGSTDEVGVLEMTGTGFLEVKNTAGIFLADKNSGLSGSVISCFMEGTRPFLVEVQALVSPTVFGFPQRKASGYETNRLQLLAAVLTKRAKINLTNQDIQINIAGGYKVKETAVDLAVAMAIYSSYKDRPLPNNTVYLGEIGLGGEIRAVSHLEKRLTEIQKTGFAGAIIPAVTVKSKLTLTKVKNITELLKP